MPEAAEHIAEPPGRDSIPGLAVPIGDILKNMLPNLGAEKVAELNHEPAPPAPPPPAAPAAPAPVVVPPPAEKTAATTDAAPDFMPPATLFDPPATTTTEKKGIPTVDEVFPTEPPEGMSEKGKLDFAKFRGAYSEAEKANAQLREQLRRANEGGANPDSAARIQELESRILALSGVVERTDLLQHPGFQQQFVVPRKQAFDGASALLRDMEISPNLLEKALSLTGREKIEALDDLTESITSPNMKMRLVNAIDRIEQLDEMQAKAMTDIKGQHERLQLEERAERHRQMEAQGKQLNLMIDSAYEQLRDKAGFEFLKKIDGNESWNKNSDEILSSARDLLTNTTNPMQLAAASILAPMALKYRMWAHSERKARLAAETELKEYKGADPGLRGNSSNGSREAVQVAAGPTSAVDAAMASLHGSAR